MIGTIVRHKPTGERMEIRTISGPIATCWRIDQPKVWAVGLQEMKFPVAIVRVENLETWNDEKQLNLF